MGYSQECVRVAGFDSPSQGQEGLGRPLSCISQLSLQAAPFRISSKAHGCPLNISCTSTSSRLHRTPLLHFCITFYAEMGLLQYILKREIFHRCGLPGEKTHSLNIKSRFITWEKNAGCILSLCFYCFLIQRENILLQQQLPSQLLCPSHPHGGGSMSPGCGHVVWGEQELS